MSLPTFVEFLRPVLSEMAGINVSAKTKDIADAVAAAIKVTPEDRNRLLKSGFQTAFDNRLAWSMIYLQRAGLLERKERGIYSITADGLNALKSNQPIDIKFLQQYPSFVEFSKKTNKSNGQKNDIISEINKSPEEIMSDAMSELADVLEDDILSALKTMLPEKFEQVIVDLMETMNYGAGEVTRYVGDGGVDGIIDEDELGLSKIYLQAKRYVGNKIQEKEMRDFVGALATNSVSKGVFITTSGFSDKAKDTAKNAKHQTIRLVDGTELAKLMIKHNLGVRLKRGYEIKEIDLSFFE